MLITAKVEESEYQISSKAKLYIKRVDSGNKMWSWGDRLASAILKGRGGVWPLGSGGIVQNTSFFIGSITIPVYPGQPDVSISDPSLQKAVSSLIERNKSQCIVLQHQSVCLLLLYYQIWGKKHPGCHFDSAISVHCYEGLRRGIRKARDILEHSPAS